MQPANIKRISLEDVDRFRGLGAETFRSCKRCLEASWAWQSSSALLTGLVGTGLPGRPLSIGLAASFRLIWRLLASFSKIPRKALKSEYA